MLIVMVVVIVSGGSGSSTSNDGRKWLLVGVVTMVPKFNVAAYRKSQSKLPLY